MLSTYHDATFIDDKQDTKDQSSLVGNIISVHKYAFNSTFSGKPQEPVAALSLKNM